MLPSFTSHVEETVNQLFSYIESQGNGDYIGEKVSQLQHSLQCAYLATQDDDYCHDDEVVLGALLHDVGRFIPAANKMPKMIAPDGRFVGTGSHEILGEQYLRQLGFSNKICQLVGAHVVAKRYLTAVEPGYYEALSKTIEQGGRFNNAQIQEARQDPLLQAKLSVRKWDDLAKDPDLKVPGLDAYKDMAIESLLTSRSAVIVDDVTYRIPTLRTAIICLPDIFGAKHVEYAKNIFPTLHFFAERGGLVLGQQDADVATKSSSKMTEILDAAAKFGLKISTQSCTFAINSGENTNQVLNSAVQPLVKGEMDISLFSLAHTNDSATDFMQYMPLVDTKIQELTKNNISVIIAEGWEQTEGTAASVLLCKPQLTSNEASAYKERSTGRLDVSKIAFN